MQVALGKQREWPALGGAWDLLIKALVLGHLWQLTGEQCFGFSARCMPALLVHLPKSPHQRKLRTVRVCQLKGF